MKPERFARFKEVLLAAANLAERDRRSYLDDACKDDPELRREVESALVHEKDSPSMMRTGGGIPRALQPPFSSPSALVEQLLGDAAGESPPTARDEALTADTACASTSAQLPDRIGVYPVEGELGRGGMGVVYRARDPRLQRQIAIKLLPSSVAGNPHFAQRFEREARILAAVNHPSFATIYSLEEADGIHFMTMELIPGSTLAEEISERGPLTIDVTLARCRQVAAALEAAHRQGIVHLDLKPQNVMVTPDGAVKVLDFGLGRFLASRSEASGAAPDADTSIGVALGTPGYMSPEQIRGEAADHRADVWAFGCIAYECLTARRTFRGRTPPAAFQAILDTEPDWEALPKNTSGPLCELVSSCLVKDPDKRLATMTEARRAIEEEIAQRTWRAARPQPGSRDESAPNNLPVPLTSFVGRRREIEEVKRLLNADRLLTLTGAGGCGKSRLAVEMGKEVLRDFVDGVWLVELGALADPGLVPRTVAAALGLKEERGRVLTETLTDHLSERTLLLVLDNCEHLLGACAELAEMLLRASPGLRIVATSRAGLGVASETTYRVPSLELPDPESSATLEELREVESIELFIERTGTAAVPVFSLTAETCPPVAEICRRLDGIPLAIELAAARTRMMSVEEIADRLDDRFRLLTGGSRTAPPRHQTLRALIDWSWEQLTPGERALLRRLSVFAGGWTLDAAEEVCAGDGIEEWEVLDLLSKLMDDSLVELDPEGRQRTGRTRYRLLETVRQYARERLEDEEEEYGTARRRHRDFFLALAEKAESEFEGADQGAWLSRLDREHDNLRAALELCKTGDVTEGDVGLRLAGALGRFWESRGHWNEGRAMCAALLAGSEARERSSIRAKVLGLAGTLSERLGDYVAARSLSEESLAIARELGDKRQIAYSLNGLGIVASYQGDYAEARSLYEESLAIRRELGDKHGIPQSLNNLGAVASYQGDHVAARSLLEESLALARELGDKRQITWLINNLGNLATDQGDYAAARSLLGESLALARELGDKRQIATSLNNLGAVALHQGDCAAARPLLDESLAIKRELGDKRQIARGLINLGVVAQDQGDHAAARSLFEEGLAIARELGDRSTIAISLENLGVVAQDQGDYAAARSLHEESMAIRRELGEKSGIATSLMRLSFLAFNQENLGRAARLLAAAEALARSVAFELREQLRPNDRHEFNRNVAALRASLSSEEFAQAWAAGQAMDLDRAIEYALGE